MGESVNFSGALEKQGRLKLSWKKYWFVLQDNILSYFKDDKLTSPQGTINVAHAITIRECKNASRIYALEISTRNKSHILAASNKEQQKKWLTMFQSAMTVSSRQSFLSRSESSTSCNSISDDEEAELMYEDVMTSAENGNQARRADEVSKPSIYAYEEVDLPQDKGKPASNARKMAQPPDLAYEDVFLPGEKNKQDHSVNKRGKAVDAPPICATYSLARDALPDEDPAAYSEVHSEDRPSNLMKGIMGSEPYTYCDVVQKDELKRLAMPSPSSARRLNSPKTKEQVPMLTYEEVTINPPVPPRPDTHLSNTASSCSERLSSDSQSDDRPPSSSSSAASAPPTSLSPVPPADVMYDDIDNLQTTFPSFSSGLDNEPTPDLPHPRLEMDWNSAFNQIRNFIANNRGPTELYESTDVTPGGGGVQSLKEFLEQIG